MSDHGMVDKKGRIVTLRSVDTDNWRAAADVVPHDDQRAFVAPSGARYLLLSHYEEAWNSLAVCADEQVVGHVMWGWDPDDQAYWIGGMLIDAAQQRQGLGRACIQVLLGRLMDQDRCTKIRLSFDEANEGARALYTSMGFVELPEREGDEIIAELTRERFTGATRS